MFDLQHARDDINRMRSAIGEVRATIERSLTHIREVDAFMRTLEARPVRPLVYADEDHPMCCDVPMWLTKLSIAEVSCANFTCQVCGRTATMLHPAV